MIKRIAIAAAYLLISASILMPTALLWDALHDLRIAKGELAHNKTIEELLVGIKVKKITVEDEWDVVHLKSRDSSLEIVSIFTKN